MLLHYRSFCAKLVWQVKLKQLKDNQDIETVAKKVTKDGEYFRSVLGQELLKPGKGEINARITKPSSTGINDPCVIPFNSKFRGAENHLCRAEIFRVYTADNNHKLSFVWSRENSSIVFPIVTSGENNSSVLVFKLEHLGKDKNSSLSAGDWVEIIDKLIVSKIQALDGNNIWPGFPERFSGNGSEGGDWVSIIHIKT
ncbi:MAG: DUF6519 domain-containing protein [Nostoc sp.]|uniref:DUF6519 domain-containing protein n=1 Tax=Nostoc sp. TaxID=1180 RepID=UPI002FF50EE7